MGLTSIAWIELCLVLRTGNFVCVYTLKSTVNCHLNETMKAAKVQSSAVNPCWLQSVNRSKQKPTVLALSM